MRELAILPVGVVNAVISYLSTRPYVEVYQLIPALQLAKITQEPEAHELPPSLPSESRRQDDVPDSPKEDLDSKPQSKELLS